ncbi:MAG: prepilin-type N-terminal cleavage/methylation domain-containing protein [Deltaproteobacteria bacterium]|nr:prepilin-type N-terminal cleavage/methylation domain-containing protein [Deltaproteobacteria bacterium]
MNNYSAIRNPKSPSPSPSNQKGWDRGFTLIEIIVVIIILAIVSAISIKFLSDGIRIYTMTVDQKALFDEGKLALERMCRDIRDANSITTPSSGGSSSSGTLLSFTRTNATAQDSAGDTIQFILSSGTLQRTAAARPTVDLASYVSSITVTRGTSPNNEITISLTLSRTSSGEILNIPLSTKVVPKNFPIDLTYTYKNFNNRWEEQRST